jgi:uncharacterized membrane protein YoaK (UPF0700 family)
MNAHTNTVLLVLSVLLVACAVLVQHFGPRTVAIALAITSAIFAGVVLVSDLATP